MLLLFVVGVDVGLVHDATGVVVAWPRDDGRVVFEARVWTPSPGNPVKLTEIEQHIEQLATRYQVAAVCYDPRFFVRSAQEMADNDMPMVEVVQNSSTMPEALQGFYTAVLEKRVVHAGGGELSAHVLGASAESTDRGWKVGKLKQSQRIDALIAAVLALYGADTLETVEEPLIDWAFV